MRRQRRGFTFLEIIVVVAILAILATLIIPRFMGRVDEARNTQADVQMKELAKTLELYRLDNGKYPTTEQGLKALVEKPTSDPVPTKWKQYIDAIPVDPWGNEYVYISPGTKGAYDLMSVGQDGRAQTEDDRDSRPMATSSPK